MHIDVDLREPLTKSRVRTYLPYLHQGVSVSLVASVQSTEYLSVPT